MWVFVKREHILKSKRNKGGKKLEKNLNFCTFGVVFRAERRFKTEKMKGEKNKYCKQTKSHKQTFKPLVTLCVTAAASC